MFQEIQSLSEEQTSGWMIEHLNQMIADNMNGGQLEAMLLQELSCQYIRQGEYGGANRAALRSIYLWDNPSARLHLGFIHNQLRKPKDALMHLSVAEDLWFEIYQGKIKDNFGLQFKEEPIHPEIARELAIANVLVGEKTQAKKYITEALRIRPECEDTRKDHILICNGLIKPLA